MTNQKNDNTEKQKIKNRFELDPERLATTDEHGHRVYLYPEDVKGDWKNRREIFYWFLIILYLVLPWVYINNKPALMIDILKREFTFMGGTLHGVEPVLFFLVIISGLFFIAFMTSLFGRVWCGWGCPQTVFIQTIFQKIETLIEGKARARKELDQAPWSFNKILRRSLKWLIFTILSLHIAHTFIGYFIGPRELFLITLNSPLENLGIFTATMISTGIILLDFGWFREQFCIIACPYGRMQSVMMDENSLIIAYDSKRGEPRRSPGIERSNEGDCINCYNCVKVCPTGIDIRRGTQLECIACTNCIDACDEIMVKLNRPKGLIRYGSEKELKGEKHTFITIRSIIYVFISFAFIALFFYFLNKSKNLDFVFLRGKENPFTISEEVIGKTIITNHFTLKMTHQSDESYKFRFEVQDKSYADKIQVITPTNPIVLDKREKKTIIFFKFNPDLLLNGTKKVKFNIVDDTSNSIITTTEVTLVGPNR